jgi:hypothetical protein
MYLRNIKKHLVELGHFCKTKPIAADLFSLEETENLRKGLRALKATPPYKLTIGFDEKKAKPFLEFVEKLYQEYSGSVSIWTPLTSVCGTYELESIFDFNFGFEFDVHEDGIVGLLTRDLSDYLLLDFFVNDSDQKVLEVEIFGENWQKASYPVDLQAGR